MNKVIYTGPFKSAYCNEKRVSIVESRYATNARRAWQAFAADGEPLFTATANLPNVELADDEVIIKDYSENEGVLKGLIEAKLIHPAHRLASSGYVLLPVCKVVQS